MVPPVARAWNAPSFALLAAACARPQSADRDAAVARAAAAAGVDWDVLARLAGRHRVEGLAHDALARAGAAPAPSSADLLSARARDIARRGLLAAVETVRLQGLLDAAGVPNLMLKGAALDILAYGRLGLKSAWDIDVLVPPASAAAARAALEAAGYRLTLPAGLDAAAFARWTALSKECVFTAEGGGQVVELHWALVEGDLLASLSVASPWQAVPIAAGLAVRTLARDELIAYLMVHGASHGWSRLKWLADLNALLAPADPAELRRLYRRAVDLGAGVCPALALRLCRRLFGLAVPAGLAREIDRDIKVAWLERLSLAALAGGGGRELHARPLVSDAILASRLLFGHGWRYRRREFARQWISLHDRTRLNLPAPLAFLYHLVRAPLWVWRRIRR